MEIADFSLVRGRSWVELWPAERQAEVRSAISKAREGDAVEFEGFCPTLTGSPRWWSVRVVPVGDSDGRVIRLLVASRDVSASRQAEETLRLDRERVDLLTDAAQVGVWFCDLPFDELFWDHRVKEHFWLPPDARVTLDTFYERIHPEDRGRTRAAIAESIEKKSRYDTDYRTVGPDGREKWIRALGHARYDSAGQPIRFDGLTIDITEDKRREKALRESEERFRTLFSSIDEGFCIIEFLDGPHGPLSDYVHVQANLAYERHTGIGNVMGRRVREMVPEEADGWVELYRNVLLTGEPIRFERELVATGRHLELSAFRVEPASRREVAVLFQDITERRQAEKALRRSEVSLRAARDEAEAASRAKDNFLAQLSHELRTPLTPVLMITADLRGDPSLPTQFRENLRTIERNVSLEARLIDDLLDITRIMRGKLSLRSELCDAHSLVNLSLDIVREEAQQKQIDLRTDLSAERSQLVGDPARLQQVFWNLLRNAIKFTPHGGNICVKSREGNGDSRTLVVSVSDDGVGFLPEDAPNLFEPFHRAGTQQGAGLGLGLAITRAVVDLHRGSIQAESAGPGKGATFTVTLPGVVAARDPVSFGLDEMRDRNDLAKEIASPRRILLVEDHEATRSVLSRLLTRDGHRVTTASCVAAGLATARAHEFDFVISDLGLPDGTGIELMMAIRAERGWPGIALSGYGTDDDLRRSAEAGFIAHLIKPVDLSELRLVIRRLTAQSDA